MRRKKEDFVIIGFAFILLVIIFILLYISLQPKEPLPQTPLPTAIPEPTTAALDGKPAILYDEQQENKLMDYVKNRRSLGSEDHLAKANILASLPNGERSGVLTQTKNIQIDYTHSADIFQVEILTTDIQAAKNEANLWFRARGLSQKAICTLPVEFYMSFDVANTLRQTNIIFNPLGNGC